MPTPAGLLQHLLVIANPESDYDPSSTALPTDEQGVYFTSRRRIEHPWIAQRGDGPTASPDISIGGQRLELPAGRTVDGECQVRIIDDPGPVAGCDWSIDLLGGVSMFDNPADWTEETSLGVAGCTNPTTGLPYNVGSGDYCVGPVNATSIVAGSHMNAGVNLLFNWNDDLQGNSPYGNPGIRAVWRTRTMTGLTPGEQVGVTVRIAVTLNGNTNYEVFMRIIGETTEEWSGHLSTVDIWNFNGTHYVPSITRDFLGTVVPVNGEVTIEFGIQNLAPSGNINIDFVQAEFAQCVPIIVPGPISDLYMTGNLADADARQRLLGWPYYLKESVDGGATWTGMVYSGFLKQATMERSLTFLLTGGDAGRGRRVSRAWAGLNPVEDFGP